MLDLSGRVFGYRTVLGLAGRDDSGRSLWSVTCKCGATAVVRGDALQRGSSSSCGCMVDDRGLVAKWAPAGWSGGKVTFHTYRANAKKKGLPFSLSFEQFVEIALKNCRYCDAPPANVARATSKKHKHPLSVANGAFTYNGLDRVDNLRGYEIDNVAPCCRMCNIAKNNHSLADFLSWAKRITDKASLEGSK